MVSEHDYAGEPDHNGDPPPVAASMAGLPDMATVCNANVVTIKHVPKKCRQLWAQVLCRELQQVTREGNLTSLTRLFALPKAVLRVLPRGGAGNRNAMANAVKLRLQRWQKGELGALWEEAVAPVPKPRGRKPKKQEEQDEAKARQMRQVVAAAEDGQYGKAARLLTSNGIATTTPQVLQTGKMRTFSALQIVI